MAAALLYRLRLQPSVGLAVLTTLLVLHMIAACARGGKLRYFFWPFGTPPVKQIFAIDGAAHKAAPASPEP